MLSIINLTVNIKSIREILRHSKQSVLVGVRAGVNSNKKKKPNNYKDKKFLSPHKVLAVRLG